MSVSHYRGKVFTNEELKGPFTEAKDDFTEAYDILQKCVGRGASVEVQSIRLGNELMLSVNGMFITINREGKIEIGEGGA